MAAGGGVAAAAGVTINGAGGRFVAVPELTDMQAAFVQAYVANGCRATEAAETAGYSTPRVDGWRLLRNQAVVYAFEHARKVRLPEIDKACVDVALEILRDKAQAGGVRLGALDRLTEIARELRGTIPDDGKPDGRGGKGSGGASPKVAELLAQIGAGQSITLRSDPTPATIDAQPIEYTTE